MGKKECEVTPSVEGQDLTASSHLTDMKIKESKDTSISSYLVGFPVQLDGQTVLNVRRVDGDRQSRRGTRQRGRHKGMSVANGAKSQEKSFHKIHHGKIVLNVCLVVY